ncbi:MAG: hypothetical protein KAR38_02535, partial [Calditrichia bacterium]|nr:hypothetical protein [Calditrichia bacterium]
MTILAMSEFMPFQEQRLKIFGLILLLSSLNYIFNTLFYRIEIKIKDSHLSIKKMEHLLNELDNQIDKSSFAQKINKFLKLNHHVDKFLMLEITEDIIPFTPVFHAGIDPALFKELKINHEQFYNAIFQNNRSHINLMHHIQDDIKSLFEKCNIQQVLPLIHHNKPAAVILFGTTNAAYKKTLQDIDWHTFVIQCAPRFELIRLIEREINIQKMAELGVMSSQLAHDFKSFLAMINLYMEDNPIILKHVRYMNKLVKDLSAYARSTNSEKIKLNINEIIELSLESTPIPENISIEKQLDKDLPPSMVDPHQM